MRPTTLLFLASVSAALVAGCHASGAPPAGSEPEGEAAIVREGAFVKIARASKQFLTLEAVSTDKDGFALRAPGRVTFRDDAVSKVGAPLGGRVVQMHVKTGDHVRPGAALVTLNCPEAAQARTGLASSLASLRSARAAVERETRMLAQGVGTERDKLTAEVQLAEIEAEVARSRATTGFVGAGEGGTVVLRAAIAGTVLNRRATIGAAVEPGGEPLIEIGNATALWVVADVFERDVTLVKEDARALVELPSLPEPVEGRVVSIGTVVNAGQRTAPVRVLLSGNPATLRPGMFGRVRIFAPNLSPILPAEAVLIKDGKDSVVYVARDELTFERRIVVVGQPIEGRVQVLSGLRSGERVVTHGALLLDGSAEQLL